MGKIRALVIGSDPMDVRAIRRYLDKAQLGCAVEAVGTMAITNFVDDLRAVAKLSLLKLEPEKITGPLRRPESFAHRGISPQTSNGRARPQFQARRGRR